MEHLFVVTYGRSGSTVLINLLNAIAGYCIRGENGGVMAHMAKAAHTLQAMHTEKNHPGNIGPNRPWHGIDQVQPETFARSLAYEFTQSVLVPPEGTRVTGFKEIRHTPSHMSDDEFDILMRFMSENFVNARFLFSTRDAVEVSKSGWWPQSKKHKPSDVLRLIADSNTRFEKWAERLGDRAFVIDYADFNGRPEGFTPLLEWLGADLTAEKVEKICGERLGHLKFKQPEEGRVKSLLRGLLKN